MEQRIHDVIVYQDPLRLASIHYYDERFDIYKAYTPYVYRIVQCLKLGSSAFKACMDAFKDETDDYEILETAEHVERYWTCKMDSQVASHPNSTQQE
jgi:hypothetical protein